MVIARDFRGGFNSSAIWRSIRVNIDIPDFFAS